MIFAPINFVWNRRPRRKKFIIEKGNKQDVVICISTDSEVTSFEDFDNMIKLLFGYGQKLTDSLLS